MSPASTGGWKKWFTGPNADVWEHPDFGKEFAALPKQSLTPIRATAKNMFCKMEDPSEISDTRFKNEGRHGPNKITIWTFKGPGGRVYGARGTLNGKPVFFATNAAPKKKQKASKQVFTKALNRLSDLKNLPGAKL